MFVASSIWDTTDASSLDPTSTRMDPWFMNDWIEAFVIFFGNNFFLLQRSELGCQVIRAISLLILLLAQDSAWGSGRKRERVFRFKGLWAKYAECWSIVSNCWDATKPKDLQGVAATLQQIGSFLSQWGSQRFGSLRRAIEQKRLVLQRLQEADYGQQDMPKTNRVAKELEELMKAEELWWKQRGKADYLSEGDRNTSFFHARASHKRKKNWISKLHRVDGSWATSEEDICTVIKIFYNSLKAQLG